MPRTQLRQQNLTKFLKTSHSTTDTPRDNSPKKKLGLSGGATRIPASQAPNLSDPSDTDSGIGEIRFEPRKQVTLDDDHDIQPLSPTRRRGILTKVGSQTDHRTSTSSDLDDNMGTNRRESSSNKAKRPTSRSPSTELEPPPKRRRRLAKGVRPLSPEKSDDLLGEINEAGECCIELHQAQTNLNFRYHSISLSKEKKLGVKRPESSDEQTSGDDERITPFQGAQQDDGTQNEADHEGDGDDSDIADFVVQDDEEAIPELPMAFSRHTHRDTSHDFKIVCQLFVHLSMTPMDGRRCFMEQALKDHEYFAVAFKAISRKISGTKDSIASSTWSRDYRKTLEIYPDLSLTKVDFAIPHCDACHLGGRLSTVTGWLKGFPYDNLSFEPIIHESDSEDYDSEGSHITGFSLGRFCAARTQIFHRLSHWSYHLYRALSEEVDLVQQPGKKRLFDRLASIPPPEDVSNPDDVMEWLDQRGVVSTEWHKLCELLQRAGSLNASVGKREEDIDLDI
ncbi:hypothetical protein B0F90DRAFT_1690122 [Multifurca ochricompacta]|uniref:DUF4211 domain-containing protein n=1 Tax=Multifurca ochricompacta TaxID=376703 RepID=A0AAD4MC46_9AGAM|nr:hypothetical protein B0F90DRAFT_1690122 [Multifurca ochricompacta]